ncbi:MAG TPA: hypothetical protein PLU17_13690 [Chitinophagaceae bacterium]|nr:hypothetical protein [Chitinophagaceae bacterium]
MNTYKLLLLLFIFLASTRDSPKAQSCTIKLHEFVSTRTAEGTLLNKPGKELQLFNVPINEHALRMYIQIPISDFTKIVVKNKLQLLVTMMDRGNQIELHTWGWNALKKNQVLTTDSYFPAGEITLSLVDADHPATVFATRKINVTQQENKLSQDNSSFPYNRNHFKIWTCKSIDDNWKPIDIVSTIKVGECVQLFFESTDKIKNQGSMRWGIFKLKADGTEEFVNQKDQGCGDNLPEFRRMSYEECDEFRSPGKYRIYISTKDDADAYFGVNNKNYFAKVDLIVQ